MPLLKKAGSARVINVSSRMHTSGKINFEELQMKKSYSASKAYANTKLALIMDTFFIANQFKNSKISFIALHPGVYSTGITRELPGFFQFLWKLAIPGPQKGAKIIKQLATEDKYLKYHKYITRLRNIRKAYEMFHDKGFDVLGVSTDTRRDSWINAIALDGLNWTNLCSLEPWNENEVVKLYALRQTSQNYLLDSSGKIIDKDIRGAELISTLEQLLP